MVASELSKAIAEEKWVCVMSMVHKDRSLTNIWSTDDNGTKDEDEKAEDKNKEKDSVGSDYKVSGLPIHEAISVGAPLEVISALVRASPSSISERECLQLRLPLHLACLNRPVNFKVVKFLLQYCSEAAAEADKMGRTPLHYALIKGCCQNVVEYLVRACPEIVKAQDEEGASPLHMACRYGHSTAVISAMLQLNPDSCILCMKDGKTAASWCEEESTATNKDEVLSLLAQYKRLSDQNFRVAAEASSRRLLV